jgi:hypothetical protein
VPAVAIAVKELSPRFLVNAATRVEVRQG